MARARDIITDAMFEIGYSPGESIEDADIEYGLRVMNDLIEQWDNEDLTLFAFRTQTFTLLSNKDTYTIGGVSPDIAGPRPLRIEDMYLQDATGNRFPVNLRTLADFISLRNRIVTSQFPSDAYYNPQFPQATIEFWPVPLAPLYDVFFTSYLQLDGFPNIDTEVSLPSGYRPALRYNVAVRLGPAFKRPVDPVLVGLAASSLGSLKRTNMIVQPAHYDRALTRNTRGGSYNIFSDNTGPNT